MSETTDRTPARMSLRVRHLVDRPPLARRDGIDELAAAGRRIEHRLGPPHLLMDERRDLAPDRRPGVLIDVAEAVLVEALVVHRDRRVGDISAA